MKSLIQTLERLFLKKETDTLTSQFPIRFKLLLIISFVLLLSMAGVIFLASYFFRKDSEVRVKENNIKINEILSLKVKSDLHSIRQDVHITASGILKNPKQSSSFAKELFTGDPSFILIGAYGPGMKPQFEAYNEEFLQNYDYQKSEIHNLMATIKEKVKKAYTGSTVIWNASPYFRHPILCLAFPLSESKDTNTILLTLVKLDRLLDAFQTSGTVETFLVGEDGSVLAHPDAKIVLSGSKLNDLPIVEKMKKSTVDNGQYRYENKDSIFYLGSFKKLGIGGVGVISQVQEDKIFEEVNNIQKRNVYLLIISLALAFIVVYIFAKSLSTPILQLVSAAREIEAGQYHLELTATTRDEIGVLTSSFVSMSKGLEEREKLKDSFGRFVNKDIAEMAARGNLSIGGERKNCAVFFSDIRSFTAISEKLEPEDVVEFLNQYMSEMVSCVKETGGTVDKFIGDAIMATWGALRSTGNDSESAVEASIRMRERLLIFNKGRGSVKKPIIRIGCGINTGNVIAGQIGSSDKMEYTVIGDTVNLASRVESLNKDSGTDILISENTYEDVKNKFNTVSMGEIKVKGKIKPQKVYAVLGRKGDPKCPKNLQELRKLVGIPTPETKKTK
ncbi:adenylate/guanylate cyclase domain-containing protein [Leptospira idonii]|uniref:HAMP domain-containing protein n=1 Tax=Leptospira idonii TaxID=1193500 RepID=A0A4R9LYN3_9LEPT|nr:adenylate/guanylate cyclase domain-containing protein [Leptospira idonii]TGN19443.1 HAMP domain-containing protein [Leptospira idonii]